MRPRTKSRIQTARPAPSTYQPGRMASSKSNTVTRTVVGETRYQSAIPAASTRKVAIATGAGALVVGTVSGYVLARPESKVIGTEEYGVAPATTQQLEEVAGLRVFFAHQSVGRNILDATPEVFRAAGVSAP